MHPSLGSFFFITTSWDKLSPTVQKPHMLICVSIGNGFHVSELLNFQSDFGGVGVEGGGTRCLSAHIIGANEVPKILPAALSFHRHGLKPNASGRALASSSLPLPLEE